MENNFWISGDTKPDLLAERLEQMRAQLRSRSAEQLAAATKTSLSLEGTGNGAFRFLLWDKEILLSFPDLVASDPVSGKVLSSSDQALVLYYFLTCDGTPPTGQWISFSELPDGRFYNQAFQGYTGGRLAATFQNDFDGFCLAAERCGGKRVHLLGDSAYEYNVLPMVNLLVVTWQGDEDFNASYQVLFDATLPHHLPTDAGAITASILTGRLTTQLERTNENRN